MDIIEVRRKNIDLYENPDDTSEISSYTRIWYSNGTDLTFFDGLTRREFGEKVAWINVVSHAPAPPVRH